MAELLGSPWRKWVLLKEMNQRGAVSWSGKCHFHSQCQTSKTPSSLSHGKPGCVLPFGLIRLHSSSSLPSIPVLHPFKVNFYDLCVFCTETREKVEEQHGPNDTGDPASGSN